MIRPEATLQNATQIAKAIKAARDKSARAQDTAVRVEGYRLMRKLQFEAKQGRPGGRQHTALSAVARYTKTGRPKKNQVPLGGLAKLIRYNAARGSDGKLAVTFGYQGRRNASIGRSYKQILIQHQEGFDVLYGAGHDDSRTELGRLFAQIGGRLQKKGSPDARYFFLRRETGRAKVPARPVIDPFWRANSAEALRRIRENFRRKMRGERI